MFAVLAHRTYRHLFAAQLIALMGTGLATVALGLLAFELAGEQAGLVLGLALTIKMVTYVTVAPVASAFAEVLPRRSWLVVLDLIRAGVALCLPFVSEIWQIYVLIFVLQAASAGFTPAFQASIPDILTDEDDYTNALSLSRLAYDLESLISPMLAAILLGFVSFNTLFFGTAFGFAASALLVVSVVLPSPAPTARRSIWQRTTRGMRLYLATPRLRGLMGLNLVVASTAAMALVNTVVLVRGLLERGESDVALILGAFGAGSMLAAILLPRVLKETRDRSVMLTGAAIGIAGSLALALTLSFDALNMLILAALWFTTGLGYSTVMTPSGRLLRRSVAPGDRPAIFAAQFTLSHACWLLTYPVAGVTMAWFGGAAAAWVLSSLAILGVVLAVRYWPANTAGNEPVTLPE
jgi:MFS family permease